MAQDSFLNQVYQGTGLGAYVKDYKHASRIFVDGNYRLAPKYGFLFHIAFDLDPSLTRMSTTDILEAGMLVKTMQLPKYTIENKTLNAYNRVNIAQTKLKYDPVTVTFHDDSADVIRDLWYDWMSFYYRDTDQTPDKYLQNTKYDQMLTQNWGYTPSSPSVPSSAAPGSTPSRLLQRIRMYSLHQKQFTEYVLINPQITAFQHGQHQQGENTTMEHSMTVSYETVLYNYGTIVPGANSSFAELHYDNSPSPLGIPSLAASVVDSFTGGAGLLGFGATDRADHQLPGNRTPFDTTKGTSGITALFNQVALGISKGNNPLQNLSIPTVAGYAQTLFGSGGVSGALNSVGGIGFPSGATASTLISGAAATGVSMASRGVSAVGSLFSSPKTTAQATSNGEAIASDFGSPELDPFGSLGTSDNPELDTSAGLDDAVTTAENTPMSSNDAAAYDANLDWSI